MTSRSPGAPAGEPNSGNRGMLLLTVAKRRFKVTDQVGCRDVLGLSCKGHDSTCPKGVGFWL